MISGDKLGTRNTKPETRNRNYLCTMSVIHGSKVLITGGNSGLGKLLALRCLAEGASTVIIWDIAHVPVEDLVEEFRKNQISLFHETVDISDVQQVQEAAENVLSQHGSLDIIINNAGIVVGKPFGAHSFNDISKTMNVNAIAPMTVTRAFLPAMIKKGSGHIVNIASAASLTPNPKMSVYAASKWAVLGWSESLRLELEAISKNLHVTTITPSYIDTGMFEGVRAPLLAPIMKAEKMAAIIISAIRKNKPIIRRPRSVYLLPIMRGILPAKIFDRVIGKGFRIYSSMNEFTGRNSV
jgi:all-trans-retinol dehydrogenase (NAD+)